MVLLEERWRLHADAALSWLEKSLAATGYRGSSHSWHPLFGWEKAYPETTGYLIETLRQYADFRQEARLHSLADGCERWLEGIQLPSGAFAGLLAGNRSPSVFNTSQILFGLDPEGMAAQKAVAWLLDMQEADGLWKKAAFVPGFVPSYYTRAVWAVLKSRATSAEMMRYALHQYARRFLPNGAVRDWGFRPGEAAFTHTIAYTLEGFWEAALWLNEPEILEKTLYTLETLLDVRQKAGARTAGRYDETWKGDYRFICVTGNCQLSILCHKVWVRTGDERWARAATDFFMEICATQKTRMNQAAFGALPGSTPFWGAYLPFRYPNWAVKFFLDALLRLRTLPF